MVKWSDNRWLYTLIKVRDLADMLGISESDVRVRFGSLLGKEPFSFRENRKLYIHVDMLRMVVMSLVDGDWVLEGIRASEEYWRQFNELKRIMSEFVDVEDPELIEAVAWWRWNDEHYGRYQGR